jgi:hypothetical protein
MAKELRLSLPFYTERVLKILQTVQKGKMQQQDVITSLEKSEGWYIRKAQTYFRYCVHWGLLNSNKECEITLLGQAIVLLNNAKLDDIVKEVIYYSFVSSKSFDALGILVQNLFNRLETSGAFNFTNADVPSIIPRFKGRHDISDLVNILSRIKILKGEREKGKLVYSLSYHNPSLGAFALSLLHYILVNQLLPPHNVKRFDTFRSYWFISRESFTHYLRRCRATGWISYQEYADINQFQFNLNDIIRLTEDMLNRKVAL